MTDAAPPTPLWDDNPSEVDLLGFDAVVAAEREFHEWLRDADHSPPHTRRGGAEWFVTSTKFPDRVAKSKGLDVIVVNAFEVEDE